MELTWKDGVTALLAGGASFIAVAQWRQWDLGFLSSTRRSILLLAILGIVMCALSSADLTKPSLYNQLTSALGIGAFLLIVIGLVTGSQAFLMLLAGDILLLWAISTVRHAVG